MNRHDSLITLNVRIKFFGPYRIAEWADEGERKRSAKYQRFLSYASWHKSMKDKSQKPYIRGTLVRSQMIRQLEEMFALFSGDSFKELCPGHALKDTKLSPVEEPEFIRHRSRYKFGDKAYCQTWKDACLFCKILGAFDAKKYEENKNDKSGYCRKKDPKSVRFSNFLIVMGGEKEADKADPIPDLASLRYKNRYDKNSRKAKDYFKVWEADYSRCSEFFGTIKTDRRLVGEDVHKIKSLLAVGLARINYLAGAPCRIDIGEKQDNLWDFSAHQLLLEDFYNDFFSDEGIDDPNNSEDNSDPLTEKIVPEDKTNIEKQEKEISEKIINIVEKNKHNVHLRVYADAVLDLRRKPKEELENLPEKNRETGKSTFWGLKESKDSENVITAVRNHVKELNDISRKAFLKNTGGRLYAKAKALKVIQDSPGRVLGENEYYARQSENDAGYASRFIHAEDIPDEVNERIITGYLQAETPFFFGAGEDGGQIDLKTITDPDGHLRLTYDILRGVLRRDLAVVISGCNIVDIGTSKPCDCPLCNVMSRCKPADSTARDYKIPPEIRHRNRISPHMGTVEHGALFNMETGPEGLRFPFILRFNSYDEDLSPLLQVLGLWADGQCFLGGQFGTGKGRFNLIEPKFYKISLDERDEDDEAKNNFYKLLKERGFIGLEKQELEQALENDGFSSEIQNLPPASESALYKGCLRTLF
ncbi:hypothetical protein QUF80_11305 [Desulfococcaceae bacterium HSG8]|nr:hypothetical protein [Desulfococcaceae bacterium HSG8]